MTAVPASRVRRYPPPAWQKPPVVLPLKGDFIAFLNLAVRYQIEFL